ncbi:paraquat-inducible protein A [Parapusillimonas granuli]|uniref:Paraquat-inducible protein A n=2 Tax=Parapusillimonas granuli TaxID=380911 RepID=A0A853G271_9BURK|nr:paraquat-inducible protein A [Parapusillimonas granuli]
MACCNVCGYVLYRQSYFTLDGWLSLVLTTLVVFGIANYFPIATLNVQAMTVHANLPHALYLTWQQGHYTLSVMTGMFAFWLPLSQILCCLWALTAIRSRRLPADFPYGMRLLGFAEPWSMVPVLMLAILVALVKFAGFATIVPGPAILAFGVLTVLLTALSRLSSLRLWRHAEDAGLVPFATAGDISGDALHSCCLACGMVQPVPADGRGVPCVRCRSTTHYRKPRPFSRVWALIIAAWIAYVPANVLPVMRIRTAVSDAEHTILGGVIELWRLGSLDLAVIVFVASVVVPMTKLLALMVLMTQGRWRGHRVQRQRTRLYELVEFIGQWSMLDVFVVILMTSMANFPGISQVMAGPAAVSFGLVVILTMMAAMSYDPRRGWDARNGESDTARSPAPAQAPARAAAPSAQQGKA